MNCAVHPDREASGYCRNCGKPMCGECSHKVRDVLYCEDCLAQQVGLPPVTPPAPAGQAVPSSPAIAVGSTKHEGRPVVAFLLGLIPGLGAVYNGEYNKAILHIVIFGAIILGLASDLGGGTEALLIFLICVFPFYMAIDAMRVAKAKETGEPLRDPFEHWSSHRPIGPVILIGLGALFLLHNFGVFEFFRFRQILVPVVLIGVGVLMMRNRMGGQN